MTPDPLRYPIGEFQKPDIITNDILQEYIVEISSFPSRLRNAVENLSDQQLDTEYRPNGWTVRQVIHHCADSHMNSLIRFKLALTEDKPIVKPYFEERWAELSDSKTMPIEPSLKILEGLHKRWTVLLNGLKSEDLKRVFIQPEHGKEFRIDENIGVYAWHCNHHLAHITILVTMKAWDI